MPTRRATPLALSIAIALLVSPSSAESGDAGSSARKSIPLGFRYDIVPLLQRQGCSSAYCHGSATGRGGFKLSLFGTDAAADHQAITEELDGRRIDLVEPAESLLLGKASKAIPHGGGLRLPEGHAAYRAVESWIARGAPLAPPTRRELAKLELERRGENVHAIATFRTATGKERRDVSHLAVFESSSSRVVRVDPDGKLELNGPGEAWIFARYSQEHARLAVVTPFAEAITRSPLRETPRTELDRAWRERLLDLGLEPASPAPPARIARRLYLDLLGRPPAPRELNRFLDLPAEHRIEITAKRLVETREFANLFAAHLAGWLEVPEARSERDFNADRNARLRDWLREAVQEDRPLRDLVDETIGSAGVGANLLSRYTDPRDRGEFIGRALLGTRLGCARCHNHPLDRWTREQHLEFSAFFASPRPDPAGGMRAGQLFHPETGDVVPPRLLPTRLSSPVPRDLSRSERLSRFVLDPGHGLFARSIANRVFRTFLGSGLVEPVDDHRLSNPATHEPMLAALARVFESSSTRLRPLVLAIVTSRIYSLSSDPQSTRSFPDGAEVRFLARREARVLDAVRFERSVRFVVGAPPLPSPFVGSSLSSAPLAKQLATLNGPLLRSALDAGQTNVDAIFDFGGDTRPQLEQLWLTILSRPPRSDEIETFAPVLEESEDRLRTGRDLAFALLASREFGSIR